MKPVRFDIPMFVNQGSLIQLAWTCASQLGITPRRLAPTSVLTSARSVWGRQDQTLPIHKCWPSLSGSSVTGPDYKGRSSFASGEDKEKPLPTPAAAMDGFALLQVITLAQIRSPSGWRASRFLLISFLRFELKQPKSPSSSPPAICSIYFVIFPEKKTNIWASWKV